MKTIYVQCSMGVAGDMLMGALYELLDEDGQKAFLKKMNSLAIPGLSVSAVPAVRCGVTGTHMEVKINGAEEMEGGHGDHEHHHAHGHAHNGIKDIRAIIKGLDVSEQVKRNASAIYDIIAAAESKVHGHAMEHIHFHEVGSLDAVADVIGNCLLMEMLGADSVQSSPICVGSGTVKCAHGILPVPAPATALILNGIPIYSGEIKTELCTPTGAALMKYFSENFGEMPSMTTEKVGYGMGTKEFPNAANCVRVVLGNTVASSNTDSTNSVYELCANIDDMTGEEIGFAMEMLLECGALDVWTEAITMKKSRPAVKLCVLARGMDRKRMIECIFKHTTTLGVREQVWNRYVLKRCEQKQETELGEVRVKFASGFGVTRGKYEYDDLTRIAREKGMSLRQVREMIGGVQLKSTDAE